MRLHLNVLACGWHRVVRNIEKRSKGGAIIAAKGCPTGLEYLGQGRYAVTLTFFDSFAFDRLRDNHAGRALIERCICETMNIKGAMVIPYLWKPPVEEAQEELQLLKGEE